MIPPSGAGILGYGDSTTVGTGDTPATAGYLPDLVALLGSGYYELDRIAKGGWTVKETGQAFVDTLDTDFINYHQNPAYILIGLGKNDISGVYGTLNATDWQNALGEIVDYMHAKFPQARIGIVRPWRRVENGQLDAMCDTWIPNVVNARPAFCFLGPDERVFIENGDDGVTYTGDGTHPNDAGYALLAAEWKTAMGV